jgi:hypothetical protein
MGILRPRDRYEMIATSLLYLQSKFELGEMNTCGPVVVRVDVFCYSVAKWRRIISSNVMQSSFVSSCRKAIPIPTERFRNCTIINLYHVLKYFGCTNTL